MIRVIVADALLPDHRRGFDLPACERPTLAGIVSRALPRLTQAEAHRVRVTIGGAREAAVVPQALWRAVRPKAGAVVVVRHVPGDPFNLIVVPVVNALLGAGIGINASLAIATFAGSVLVPLGVSVAVTALASSLIPTPPKQHQLPQPEDLYQLDGWQNQANPNEAIPFPVGRIRMAPLFAARPWSEIIDGEQYLYGLFLWGHGRLDVRDLKIKDTPIADYGDVVVNTREGSAGDAPLELIREQVLEDRLAIRLSHPDPDPVLHSWTSPRATDRIRLILQFPGGLFYVKDNGKMAAADLRVMIRQRLQGSSDWSTVHDTFINAATNSGFFRQFEWRPPTRGIWEVQVHRVSPAGGITTTDMAIWASAAGIRERAPIAHDGPLALTELRIKASALANGTLDAFNGVVQRYAPVWTGSGWQDAPTRNPASAALALLQSAAGAWPVAPEAIHWDEFLALFAFCQARGLKYDRVLSGDATLGEALHGVLSAGRATWRRDGIGWGVIIDRPQDTVVDRISPINASSIRWSRNYLSRPDAFRVSFRDETNGWEQAERIIPWPGFEGAPRSFEDLPLDGKTDPAEIWIEARRRQHELDHRVDTFTCIQSGALRHATRGDAVGLSCDILDEVQVAAVVRRADGRSVILDAPVVMQEGLQYALKWQVYDADDTVGDVVQASVVTRAGERQALLLAAGSEVPPDGAQVHFGLATRVDFACRIISVEPAQDAAFRLTLQNDAPEVDTLTDAERPPAWVRVAGDDVLTAGTPEVPVIGPIALEAAEYDYSGVAAARVSVPVSLPPENRVSIGRIELSHRVVGAAGYSVTDVPGTSGTAMLTYPPGTAIELFAVAVSVFGDPSAASATERFTVSGTVPRPPRWTSGACPPQAGRASATGGPGHAQIAFATAADTAPDTAKMQLFRCPAGDTLNIETDAVGAPRPTTASSSGVIVDGDASRGTLLVGGDMWDAADWTVTEAVIGGGVAANTLGTVGLISQGLSLEAGGDYRGEIVVTGLTAGTITLRLAGGTETAMAPVAADGAHLFTLTAATGNDRIEIAWSADCDGAVASVLIYRTSATAAPQGNHDYYLAPVNGDQIANTPTGPLSARII